MSINVMKQALEALEEIESYYIHDRSVGALASSMYEASNLARITATTLRQAIEQAEQQEPVAYDKTELNCFAQDLYDQKIREGKRGHYESMFHVIHQCIKRVAPPPRQPLTDEEISDLWDGHTVPVFGKTGINPIVFARAIEAAHGIKGEA